MLGRGGGGVSKLSEVGKRIQTNQKLEEVRVGLNEVSGPLSGESDIFSSGLQNKF